MTDQAAIQRAELTGGPTLPAVAGIFYGLARMIRGGLQDGHALVPAALVGGGVVSLVCVMAYIHVVFSPPGRSWAKAAGGISGLVPYVYSLFLIWVGLSGGWHAISRHTGALHVAVGVVLALLGWRMLYTLAQIKAPASVVA